MATTSAKPRTESLSATRRRTRLSRRAWVLAALAVVVRLPFVARPTSPDEGGYLLLASQWHHGSSLYGDYWLARPPLLVGISALADALGGTVALRAIGLLAVAVCVLLAAMIGRAVAPPGTSPTFSQLVPATVVAVFLSTPLFGTTHVDGEMLAAPFVLGGVLAYLRSTLAVRRRAALGWTLAAGGAATCAAMVKQNSVDVFVLVGACLLLRLLARDGRRAVRTGLVFAAGAVAAATLVLGAAALRGTDLAGLWGSVVTFRVHASSTLGAAAPEVYTTRLHHLLLAVAASLAPLVLVVLAWQARGRPIGTRDRAAGVPDLRWPAYALLVWEVVAVAGGGSYWLHYLVDLVPGMTVLAVAAAQRPPSARRALSAALSGAALSTVIAVAVTVHAGPEDAGDQEAVAYLQDHARPGDTATVAFGHANILWDAGLQSPYPELWALPVRVRDPHLTHLSEVLASPEAPTWVVVAGTSLASWGLDATHANRVLAARYHRVADEGPYVVWRRTESAG